MPIIWNPKTMAVGHPLIDHEHRYLFALINCVDLSIRLQDIQLMETYIDQLIGYTKEHFDHEERIQKKLAYPEFELHKIEHQEILEKLNSVKTRLIVKHMVDEVQGSRATPDETIRQINEANSIDAVKLAQETTELIQHWITTHVLGSDFKLKPYIQRAKEALDH